MKIEPLIAAAAAELAALPADVMNQVRQLYRDRIQPLVHQRW